MGSRAALRGTVAGVLVALTAALLPGTGSAAAGFEVVDAELVPAEPDLTTGLARLQVVLTLTSDSPLPPVIGVDDDWPTNAFALPVDDAAWQDVSEITPFRLDWGPLTQLDGTATAGRWQALADVSAGYTGTWLLAGVRDPSSPTPIDDTDFVDVTDLAATATVGDPDVGPVWSITNASAPVRVVTGSELWTERVRITDRATGAGLGGFVQTSISQFGPPARVPTGTALLRAAPDGSLTVRQSPVVSSSLSTEVSAYAGRRSRGFSLEAMACVAPVVKWQANQRFSVSGRTVTASGNAWPAPSVFAAANDGVRLQQLVGRTWRTVANGNVRHNGRYDVVWTAPTAGTQVLRIWKPGGSEGGTPGGGCAYSVGTTLAATSLVTR